MEKQKIINHLKEHIANHNIKGVDVSALSQDDIILGEEHYAYCRKYRYTCTGMGEKFGNSEIRFPLTKEYTTNAMWFYTDDKALSTTYFTALLGAKTLEQLGGAMGEGNEYEAIKFDAYFKLREDFRMYDCRTYPDWIRIDDYEQVYESAPIFTPIYLTSDPQNAIGFVSRYPTGETIAFNLNVHSAPKSAKQTGKKWSVPIIIAGILCPPILVIYLIYKALEK